MNFVLACCNAGFTLLSAGCLLTGYRAIRRGQRGRHKRFMVLAFAFAAAFLASFVVRYLNFGVTAFNGAGLGRAAFMAVLISHEALSVPTVALVVGVLGLGLAGRYSLHRELARITFPIWLFVSLSGLLIFVLLYLAPGQP